MSTRFSDRLAGAVGALSPVCVGLDPVLESLPDVVRARHHEPTRAIADFCKGVLDVVRGIAPAVKIQSACFERYGSAGFGVMEGIVAHARDLGLVVIWDAKRGDISTTGAHYAAAANRLGAHAVTVNAYMGESAITPFLDAGLGVFALARTSNPDSDAVQSHALRDGRSVAAMVGELIARVGEKHLGACGMSDLGAVVGATKAGDAAVMRAAMPRQVFLIPGYGAQGGTAEDIRAMLTPEGRGVLVTASRSVLYPKGGEGEWTDRVRTAAQAFAREIAAVVTPGS